MTLYVTDDSPRELTDGEWVVVRGVARWVPAPPSDAQVAAVASEPNLTIVRKRVPTTLVACPYCGARVAETCKSSGGNPVVPHSVRLAPRLCPCGAALAWKKQLCDPCRAEARKQTYRLRETRIPSRHRRAS